ncbi:glycosyltransferase family 4 protein [Polaribacter sp.]|nr:glycosyltransferase family 4 protein [Polaribacter sp.]
MKKLLIIHHSSVIGGAGISLFNLIQVAKEDFDITVYVSNLHDDYSNFLISNNIHVQKYEGRMPAIYYHASSGGVTSKAFWLRLVLIPIKYKFWKKVIQNSNADLVLVNSLVLCWMSILTSKYQLKSLCFVRETFVRKGTGAISKIQRRFLALFTGVSFISNYDLKVANLPGIVKKFVNHNYIIPKENTKLYEEDNAIFSILYIGGISKIKGIEVVIKAAKILKSFPDIHFNIVGEDYSALKDLKFKLKNIFNKNIKLSKKIKKQVVENDLQKTVSFHGLQKEMDTHFKACDVLICPIVTPHQQRGIFEAGWYSKPVIVSDFEQLHWSVKDGANGAFFKPNSAEGLADKILNLYHNRTICIAQGQQNKINTLKNHTKDNCMTNALLTLKETLNV